MDNTLGNQMDTMGADLDFTDLAPEPTQGQGYPPQAQPPSFVAKDGTLGEMLAAGEDDAADQNFGEFFNPEGDAGSADATANQPDLSSADQELLDWSRSPVGQRFAREARALTEQYGSEDALLAALDAPVVDEAYIQEMVSRQIAPLLQATDEYGELKYRADDPLIQMTTDLVAQNIRHQTIQQMTQERQMAQVRQTAQERQIEGLLSQYPHAEPNALRVAAQSGGDLTRAAQASHAHYSELLTRGRADAINRGIAQPTGQRFNRAAPTPLTPGGRAPSTQGIRIPDPIKEPGQFERMRQLLAAGKIKI